MISTDTAIKLVRACACHMKTNEEDAFTIICASCQDGVVRDPDAVYKQFDNNKVPLWFVETCCDIITGKIPLTDYPVIEGRKTLFD